MVAIHAQGQGSPLQRFLNECRINPAVSLQSELARANQVAMEAFTILKNESQRPCLTNWIISRVEEGAWSVNIDALNHLCCLEEVAKTCLHQPIEIVGTLLEEILKNRSLVSCKKQLAKSVPALQDVPDDPENIREWFANPDNKEVLRKVEELDLSGLQLVHVPEEIKYLEKLRRLNLSGNCLQHHSLESLAALQELQSLDISACYLEAIPTQHLIKMSALQYLDLSQNDFKNLSPHALSGITQVKELVLYRCSLQKIPKSLKDMSSLQYLDLSGNDSINNIPYNAFEGLQIVSVDLSDTGIRLVPSAALRMVKNTLTDLNLSATRIARIARDAFQELKLRRLNLSNTRMTTVPSGALQGLQGTLQVLDLSGNEITRQKVGKKAFQNLQLQELDLGDMHLTVIPPETLQSLKSTLQILRLGSNAISHIDDILFEGFVLEKLDLCDMELEEIPSKALQEIKETLKGLDLSGNNIKSLGEGLFAHLKKLETLFLDSLPDNLEISDKAFEGLSALKRLSFSHTKLEEFPWKAIQGLANLEMIG